MCEEERQHQGDPVVDSRIGSAALTWTLLLRYRSMFTVLCTGSWMWTEGVGGLPWVPGTVVENKLG